jgi:hypothetical protein
LLNDFLVDKEVGTGTNSEARALLPKPTQASVAQAPDLICNSLFCFVHVYCLFVLRATFTASSGRGFLLCMQKMPLAVLWLHFRALLVGSWSRRSKGIFRLMQCLTARLHFPVGSSVVDQ